MDGGVAARANRFALASLTTLGLAFAVAGSPAQVEAKAARPDPLAAAAGCERYAGVPVGANDSSQRFELVVCPDPERPDRVSATVQTSSLISGWSKRRSEGGWDPDGKLRLVDREFLDYRPEPTWRFCLIDALVLERSETGLVGDYVSAPCEDRATLRLQRLADEAPAGAPGEERGSEATAAEPTPVPASPPVPAAPQTTPSEPAATEPGCACAATPATNGLGPVALLASLALLGVHRRQPPA